MDFVLMGDYTAFHRFINQQLSEAIDKEQSMQSEVKSQNVALKEAKAAKRAIGRKNKENAELHEQAEAEIAQMTERLEVLKKTLQKRKNEVVRIKSLEKLKFCRLQTGAVISTKALLAFDKKLIESDWDISLTHQLNGLEYRYVCRKGKSKGTFTLRSDTYTELLRDVDLPILLNGDIQEELS